MSYGSYYEQIIIDQKIFIYLIIEIVNIQLKLNIKEIIINFELSSIIINKNEFKQFRFKINQESIFYKNLKDQNILKTLINLLKFNYIEIYDDYIDKSNYFCLDFVNYIDDNFLRTESQQNNISKISSNDKSLDNSQNQMVGTIPESEVHGALKNEFKFQNNEMDYNNFINDKEIKHKIKQTDSYQISHLKIDIEKNKFERNKSENIQDEIKSFNSQKYNIYENQSYQKQIFINIDDEDIILKMNSRLFKKINITINKCKSISNYIQLIESIIQDHKNQKLPFIIAIFDHMLDNEYGHEGIKLSKEKFGQDHLEIKQQVLTSTEDSETKMIYDQLGAEYLVKPLTKVKLKQTIEELIF